MRRMSVWSLVSLALLCPGVALAQGVNVDTFELSGSMFDAQGTLQVAHPHLGMRGAWYAGLGFGYAANPLVYVYEDETEDVIVASQMFARVSGGYTIGEIMRLDVEIPTYPSVKLDDSSGFAFGDVRLGATIPLVKYEDEGFGLALVPSLSLPTGSTESYTGSGGVSGGATLAAGVQAGAFGAVANIGIDAGGKSDPLGEHVLGTALPFGVNLHYGIGELVTLGAEADGSVDLSEGMGTWRENPVEAHGFVTVGSGEGILVTLGGGAGVVAGIGAPDYRALLAVGWRNPGAPPDRDKDGLADPEDSCPDQPEDADGYEDSDGCPDLDNDGDGLADTSDECPNVAEDVDGFRDLDGCPDPDNDGDGLNDPDDRCVNDPGPESTGGCPDQDGDTLADLDDACPAEPGPRETDGCPDSDGDRVPDMRDSCPSEPADKRIDPRRSNGCPSRVVVTKQSIEILEMVFFETNKAVIKPVSYGLLDDVARVLNQYPDIKLVEVSGHTDDVGKDDANMKLSQARSEAVMKYLIEKGQVDPARLVARGYGETKPIDTNTTAEGRAKNRRVAFTILEQ